MSLLDDVAEGAIVGIDTAPLIYFGESHPKYGPIVRPFFEDRLDKGLNEGVASTAALAASPVVVQNNNVKPVVRYTPPPVVMRQSIHAATPWSSGERVTGDGRHDRFANLSAPLVAKVRQMCS